MEKIKENQLSNCPVCNEELCSTLPSVQTYDPFKIVNKPFYYYKCTSCGCWILNPRPELDEMSKFYESDFLLDPSRSVKSGLFEKLSSYIQEFNLISEVKFISRHLKKNDKYLDYSAGNGQILGVIKKREPVCEYYATEFSGTYRNYLADVLGWDRVKADLSDFSDSQTFNLISLFGVLEHVQDPGKLIHEMSNRLESGGKLVITVPNVNALQRFMFGGKWYSWLAPRHWQMFNIYALKNITRKCGMVVVDEKYFFLRTCSATLVISMFPSLDPLLNKSKKGLIVYALLFYLFIPIELIASIFKSSGFMGIVTKKID